MTGRLLKQEQERAGDDVIEVAAGVLRVQLPIDLTGLGHVNCYVLEDRGGLAVVDPGLPGADSYRALRSRFESAGLAVERIHTVIVTHSHPDHYGGAGRLRHETGAQIVTHRRFRLMWDPFDAPDVDIDDLPDLPGWDERRFPWDPPPWGGEGMSIPWRRRLAMRAARRFPNLLRTPVPTLRLDDADTIRLADRDWIAIHTPGHTFDHLCLFDPTEGVMLSGDHVLPTITPHIGGNPLDADPIATFFGSLDRVAAHGDDVAIVLPAHGQPFSNLANRTAMIKQHHVDRLARLQEAVALVAQPATVHEYATHLFSERAQGPLADSETFAHLEHLRLEGMVERSSHDGRLMYRQAS